MLTSARATGPLPGHEARPMLSLKKAAVESKMVSPPETLIDLNWGRSTDDNFLSRVPGGTHETFLAPTR